MKTKFVEGPNGQPVAVQIKRSKDDKKKIAKLEKKLAATNTRMVAAIGHLGQVRAEQGSAAEQAPPPSPKPTYLDRYKQMKAGDPYGAAEYLLNNQYRLHAPAEDGPEAA